MSDASLVSFLQSELLLLSNEIKKKYPEIKESIENIFQLIRKTKDDPDRPNAVDVFSQTELILQPIVLSSRTGNSRVLALAINCLQRLVVFKAFPRECIGSVFGVLEIAADMNSDIQLKTLQCLSPLMANYNDLYGAEIIKIFSIAFKLQESKTGMVNNATAAIIRQMIISLFEWVAEEQQKQPANTASDLNNESSSIGELSHAKDALLIFSDVTCRLDDRKCEVLDLTKVDKPFALDLIESILVNHGNVIRNYRPFAALIQERICPYLIQSLKQNENSSANKMDFPKTCRHWRIIQLIVNEFNDLFPDEGEIFIAFGIRILRENSSNWESAMVLEVSKGILQSPSLMEEIYLICEKKESLRLLKDLIEVLLEVMKRVLDSHPSDSQGQIADALTKSSVLTQFDKSAPPAVSPIALLLLAYDAFNGWFGNMSTLVKGSCVSDSNSSSSASSSNNSLQVYKSSKSSSNVNPKTVVIVTDLVIFSGSFVVSMMERVFVELCANQPQLHQSTLEFFSRSFLVFSVFEFRSQLRHLSAVLLNLAAPVNIKDFRKSHLLIIQMVLETGYGVAQLLEDSLVLLVKVIQVTEHLQNLKSKKQQAQGMALPQLIEEDVLAKALDLSVTLTESTAQWEEQSFTFLIQSYGQFIAELLSTTDVDERGLLLILEKLKRLTGLNLFRFVSQETCSTAWDLIIDEFCKLMRVKESILRLNSIDTFSLIVDLFIKSVPPARMKASLCEKSDDSPCESLQMRLLAPMAKFTRSASTWIDVQKGLLDSLMKYLNIYGECLNESSWSLIWSILKDDLENIKNGVDNNSSNNINNNGQLQQQLEKDSTDSLSAVSLYQKVHDAVKIASNDFLPSIPINCLADFITIISQLGRINLPGELNIPLNTVRYLWDISDYLCSGKNLKDVFLLWKGLLLQLSELSLDPRPELRNSAVQTLLRTINMNGGTLKGYPEHWNCIFEEIIFVFLQKLRECAVNSRLHQQQASPNSSASNSENSNTVIPLGFAHFSRDTEAKQWDETESTVMSGVTTLINTHFKGVLASELPHFPQHWQRFLHILKNYVLLKDGSVELTSVAISSLLQLALCLKTESSPSVVEVYAQSLWEIWESIGAEGFFRAASPATACCLFFTQDSLLKYLKIFVAVFDLCPRNLNWLKRSLKCLTACIQCLTPSDQVRDVEVVTEVQKVLISQVLMEVLVPKALGSEKVEVLLVMSDWLGLTTNAPSGMSQNINGIEMISMGYASLRSRQSTASTSSTINDGIKSPASEGIIKYTYIAMASMLLEKIPGIVLNWISCSEEVFGGVAAANDECLSALLKSLGRFMALKYKCPMNSKVEPIWRTSTSVFVQILTAMLAEKSVKFSEGLWRVILTELKTTLHSCKEMFNRSVKLDVIEADEKFDCQLIGLICDSMIPRSLNDKSNQFVEEAVKILFQVARITKFPGEGSVQDDFSFPSGIKALPVAVKEIISFHAYKSTFKLAKTHQKNSFVWTLILDKLQSLLRKHLDAFECDRKVFGNDFSFPRLRDLELHCILEGMIKLEARDELKQVYDLIVRCADFGAGCCEGAKLIVKDCRRVLLLLSSSTVSEQVKLEEDSFDFEVLEDYNSNNSLSSEEKEFENQVHQSPLMILKASRESIKSSKSSSKASPNPATSATITSPTVSNSSSKQSPTLSSSRRSVSEEFFDHLTHDLRIMALSQDSSNNQQNNQKDPVVS